MPSWLFIRKIDLARSKSIVVLRDLAVAGHAGYGVALTYRDNVYAERAGLAWEAVEAIVEEQVDLPGPEGDSGWLAVLGRITGRPAPRGAWIGSPGERAARSFAIGTWNWLVALRAYGVLVPQ